MAKKPETKFKEKVRSALETLPNTWCEKIQQVAIRGTPDFLCCVNGSFVALELKKDDKQELDALQKYKLAQIENAGGLGLKITPENWLEVFDNLRRMAVGDEPDFH